MKNKKGKTDKSKKFSAIVLIFVSVCLVLYIVQAMYFDKSSISFIHGVLAITISTMHLTLSFGNPYFLASFSTISKTRSNP